MSRRPSISRSIPSTAFVGAEPTGFAELDALLPDGGWPRGALSEILIERDRIDECDLLLPALAALAKARRRIALVAPPRAGCMSALISGGVDPGLLVSIGADDANTNWTAEQCLRAGGCGAVLNWLPDADYRQLRRLQIAAEADSAIGFVFRPLAAASQTSPAALRLMVTAPECGAYIEILKAPAAARQPFISTARHSRT